MREPSSPEPSQSPLSDEDLVFTGEPHLEEEDVHVILRAADGEECVVVGGQALNLWCEVLHERAPQQFAAYGPHTSKDFDYWGMADAARTFGDRVGGQVELPAPFRATPNSAVVTFERNGRRIVVDFLASVAGLTEAEIRNGRIEIGLAVRNEVSAHGSSQAGGSTTSAVMVSILSPLHVVMSRFANIVTLGRGDPHALRQARTSLLVLHEYLGFLLEEAENREDLRAVGRLLKTYLRWCNGTTAFEVWRQHGIDPIEALDRVAEGRRWDPRFREHQIVGTRTRLREHRQRKLQEIERRGGAR